MDTITFTLGEEAYTIKPLTLKQLRKSLNIFQSVSTTGTQSTAWLDTLIQSVLVALEKNYPAVTAEMIEDTATLQQIKAASDAIAELSGLRRAPAGEAAAGKPTGQESTAA